MPVGPGSARAHLEGLAQVEGKAPPRQEASWRGLGGGGLNHDEHLGGSWGGVEWGECRAKYEHEAREYFVLRNGPHQGLRRAGKALFAAGAHHTTRAVGHVSYDNILRLRAAHGGPSDGPGPPATFVHSSIAPPCTMSARSSRLPADASSLALGPGACCCSAECWHPAHRAAARIFAERRCCQLLAGPSDVPLSPAHTLHNMARAFCQGMMCLLRPALAALLSVVNPNTMLRTHLAGPRRRCLAPRTARRRPPWAAAVRAPAAPRPARAAAPGC